jgi:hypothetical protein
VTLLDQVAVPSQHGVGLDQQPEPAQNLARQRHQQSGEEGPVFRDELRPVRAELPFKDRDLVAQGEDLRVLVVVAHQQQPKRLLRKSSRWIRVQATKPRRNAPAGLLRAQQFVS